MPDPSKLSSNIPNMFRFAVTGCLISVFNSIHTVDSIQFRRAGVVGVNESLVSVPYDILILL